jgi:hypothetical protein
MFSSVDFAGVIKTTGRKLDRENQAEHILEVSTLYFATNAQICEV